MKPGEVTLTVDQLRRIVFDCSVAYASALRAFSVQTAEAVRGEVWRKALRELGLEEEQ